MNQPLRWGRVAQDGAYDSPDKTASGKEISDTKHCISGQNGAGTSPVDSHKSDTEIFTASNWKHVHIAVRMQRAADLAHAIAAADPEDARPLMTAALIDLHAGMPPSEALDPSAAQDWAERAGEAELVAMAEAVAAQLQGRSLHLDQRKGALRWLFLSLPFENRLRFLHWGKDHVTCD